MKNNKSKISCKRGFTLIELFVVVLIIGILAAVAVPQYQVAVGKSQVVSFLPIMRSVLDAQEIYYLSNGTYTTDMDELDVNISYSSKDEVQDGGWGEERVYTIDNKTLTLYKDKHVVVSEVSGVVLNVYGEEDNYAHCYTKGENGGNGEKICKTLGSFSKTSKAGYNVYKILF